MSRLNLPIANIVIPERFRVDMGDIPDLARSIDLYGLIQPIVVDQNNVLIAGGRRYAAHKHLNRETIDVVYREALTEDERRILELEENVRRKDFDWRERVKAIREIHKLKRHDAVLGGEQWGYRETGEMLGQAHSSIYYAIIAADMLDAGDKEANECGGLTEFIRMLVRRREDESNKKLAKARLTASLVTPLVSSNGPTIGAVGTAPQPMLPGVVVHPDDHLPQTECRLSRWLRHVDIRQHVLDETYFDPAGESVGHVITDPPYAIDTDNMEQDIAPMLNIDSIRDTHRVADNLALLEWFVPVIHHQMKPDRWLVMWCDPYNWRWLCDLCEKAGFRVQRWPLVWIKTHACTNGQPMKNFTKTTEFAVVAAKGSPTLLSPQAVSHYACSNDETRRQLGHPFAKPIELWKWLLRAFVSPGTSIFDPFMGRGSSLLAAIDLGITPTGCELDEGHFSHCYNNVRARYEQTLGKDSVRFT